MENNKKVKPLEEAIQAYILPEMSIHVSDFFSFPTAALRELARQFWEKDPRFTLIITGLVNQVMPLMVGGCVKKVIHTFAGDIYPTPGPNAVFQEYFKTGQLDYERWTMLSLNLRLVAGAMNIDYMPTRSLMGSDLAKENAHAFKIVEDPFGEGQPMGVVKALHPDVTLIHGVMGDELGNTILPPICVTGIPGVFASKKGAVVSVEKIVPTETLKKYAHLVKLPGHMVRSISEVPFGAHPWCLLTANVNEVDGYDHDYKLHALGRELSKDSETLNRYIKEWVLETPTQEDYLNKVGRERLDDLKKSYHRIFEQGVRPLHIDAEPKSPAPFSPQEIRIYAVTMKIAEIIRAKGYPLVVAGIGMGNLATWIAKEMLKRENIHFEPVVDNGLVAYEPQPGNPFIWSLNNLLSSTILTGANEIYTQFCQKGRNRSLGVLGSGQIDKYGNLNSTFIPPDIFLPGSGGANDVASYSDEVLVTMPQSTRRFVDQVPYVTCTGENIRILISDLGVFEKLEGENKFVLTEYFCLREGSGEKECVLEIQEKCGWDLKISPKLKSIKKPPPLFMDVLNAYDPEHFFRKDAS